MAAVNNSAGVGGRNNDPDDECCICRQPLRSNRRRLLPCGHHRFCSNCIALLQLHSQQDGRPVKCPLCRKFVRTSDDALGYYAGNPIVILETGESAHDPIVIDDN